MKEVKPSPDSKMVKLLRWNPSGNGVISIFSEKELVPE